MIVEQIWTGNAYRNFNYLIVCPERGEALAVDPLDHQKHYFAAAHIPTGGWTLILRETEGSILKPIWDQLSYRLTLAISDNGTGLREKASKSSAVAVTAPAKLDDF